MERVSESGRSNMIREIGEADVAAAFFALMGELECGRRFNENNATHVAWLTRRIALRFAQGARALAYMLDDGTPAGFISFLIDEGPPDIPFFGQKAEILDFAFLPAYRSMGYGSVLLKRVEALCAQAGVYVLYTSTYAANHRAITFYGRNGLVPVATLPDVHGPGDEGMVYMRKIIKPPVSE
jgi:GNAT superfamily N-acetyltransferase